MTHAKFILMLSMLFISSLAIGQTSTKDKEHNHKKANVPYKVNKSEAEWRKQLTAEEFKVLRQKGTERAFTGEYDQFKEKGTFTCAGCGQALFSSKAKFDSGTGWPSYYEPISKDAVREEPDNSYGMKNTEILCSNCGGHLGHVFPDGPRPTGLRYCINSVSLDFVPQQK